MHGVGFEAKSEKLEDLGELHTPVFGDSSVP